MNRMNRQLAQRGIPLIAAAAVLWGTAGITGDLVNDRTDLSPVTVGFIRLLIGAIALTLSRVRLQGAGSLRPPAGALPGVIAIGAGLGAYQACYFAAVNQAGVAIATLIALGLAPIIVALVSVVADRDSLSRGVGIALGATLSGLVLLVGWPAAGQSWSGLLIGGALAAASAGGYALVTLISRPLTRRVDSGLITTLGFAIGAVVIAPLGIVGGFDGIDLVAIGLLLYLGIVPSAIAYALFFAGMRSTPPAVAAIVTLVEPLTATLLAVGALGEPFVVRQALGGALLLAAVVTLALGGMRDPRRMRQDEARESVGA